MVAEKRAPAARAPREEGKEAEIVPPQPGTVYDVFKEVFPHVPFVATQGLSDVIITVPREAIHNVLRGAREEEKLKFDYLRDLCGVDEVERDGSIEIVYHLYSFTHKHTVTLKCPVPADDPVIPSAIDIWVGADWHERETAEMFGVTFEGHPHLVPLLLEEGLNIHPLRKNHPLAEVEIKQGLDVVAFKERFNWGGSGIGEEVVSEEAGTVSTEAAATAAPAAPAAPRKKLTPEELEAAKQRAAAMRAEHEAKKAAGEFQPGERKKRYTPEEIAAIKERAGVTAPAPTPTAEPAPEQAGPPAPEPEETAAAEAPAEAAAAPEAAAPAAAPARKLTPEEIEEVKKRAAAIRAEHAEKKARGEVSAERKKRYTPEEIEEIKRRAQEQKGG